MPRLTTIGNAEIRVYPDDTKKHKRAHFHAASPDVEAVLGLPELDLIAGSLKNLADVVEWAAVEINLKRLMDLWDLGNPTMKVKRQ